FHVTGVQTCALPISRLQRRYGSEAADVEQLARDYPELAGPLFDGCAVTGEELLFGVLAEGAASVDDLLNRRTRLGLVPADAERARPAAERILARARPKVARACPGLLSLSKHAAA